MILATLAVAACGGGDDRGTTGLGSGTSLPPPTSNAPTNTQTQTDPTIPSSITAAIVNVVTPSGQGTMGNPIPISLDATLEEEPAIAVDLNGNPVLAAMVDLTTTTSTTTFSADSTALTLIRLVIGDIGTNSSPATLDAAIRASAGYDSLVSMISADLSKGTRPLGDSAVAQAIISVGMDMAPTIAITSNVATRKDSLASPAVTSVSSLTPYEVPGAGDSLKLAATGSFGHDAGVSANPGTIFVTNSMPIPWNVRASIATTSGVQNEIYSQFILNSNSDGLLSLPDSPFNLTIEQNGQTAGMIMQDFGLGLTAGALKSAGLLAKTAVLALSGDNAACAAAVASPIGKAAAQVAIDADSSFFQEVQTVQTTLSQNAPTILAACAPSLNRAAIAATAEYFGVAVTTIAGVLTVATGPVAIGAALALTAGVVNEAIFADNFEGPYTMGVCAASDHSIHSCVSSFEFSPTSLLMAPGAQTVVSTTGIVQPSGMDTVLPGDLQITQNDASVVTVSGTSSFTVTALTLGSTSISVLDPSTGATNATPYVYANPFQVTVAKPTLLPSATTLTVGNTDQTLTVTLQGPAGESVCGIVPIGTCISVPNDVSWSAVPTATSVQAVATSGPIGSWVVPANAAAGTIAITALAGGITYGPVSITVTASNVELRISPMMPSVVVGTSATLLTVSATDSSGNTTTTPPNLNWTTSDVTIATVAGGRITGNAVGSATITATDPVSGASASTLVTVTSATCGGTNPDYLGLFAINPVTASGGTVYEIVAEVCNATTLNGTVNSFAGGRPDGATNSDQGPYPLGPPSSYAANGAANLRILFATIGSSGYGFFTVTYTALGKTYSITLP